MRAQRTGRGRQERRVSSLANAAALRVLAPAGPRIDRSAKHQRAWKSQYMYSNRQTVLLRVVH